MARSVAAANSLGYSQDPAILFERSRGGGSYLMTHSGVYQEPSNIFIGGQPLDDVFRDYFDGDSDVDYFSESLEDGSTLTEAENATFADIIEREFSEDLLVMKAARGFSKKEHKFSDTAARKPQYKK